LGNGGASNVHTYDSAAAFLEALLRAAAGCVITDVQTPDIDGVKLLRRLNEPKRSLPVIVMISHGDVRLAVEPMKLGAVDFLEKPLDDDALLAAVHAALGWHLSVLHNGLMNELCTAWSQGKGGSASHQSFYDREPPSLDSYQ
jgi:FixJ family two-component response regulator